MRKIQLVKIESDVITEEDIALVLDDDKVKIVMIDMKGPGVVPSISCEGIHSEVVTLHLGPNEKVKFALDVPDKQEPGGWHVFSNSGHPFVYFCFDWYTYEMNRKMIDGFVKRDGYWDGREYRIPMEYRFQLEEHSARN